MNEDQMKISKENQDNQELSSQIQQNEQEDNFEKVCQNFLYFIDQINLKQTQEQQSHKKKIKKNLKNTKKKASMKTKKKTQTKSVSQENSENVIHDINQKQTNNFHEELKKLIQQGTPLQELEYLMSLLQKKEHQKSIEEIKEKFPTLLKAFRAELKNQNYLSHNRQCFQTYLQKSNQYQGIIPQNCTHVKICYYIWQNQNKTHIDPTLRSKEIKNEQLKMKLQDQ